MDKLFSHLKELLSARRTVVGGGVSTLSALAGVALDVPARPTYVGVGAITLAAALANLVRWLIHVRLYVAQDLSSYEGVNRRLRRSLNRRVAYSGIFSLAWVALAVWMLLLPTPVWQGVAALFLFVVLHCSAGSTLLAIRALRLLPARAVIVQWPRVKRLRRVLEVVPAFGVIDSWFSPVHPGPDEMKTLKDVSAFVGVVTLVLLVVASQAGSAVIKPSRWERGSSMKRKVVPRVSEKARAAKSTGHGVKATAGAAAAIVKRSPAHASLPASEPTAEEQCGTTGQALDVMAQPQRASMRSLFEAAGATQAGCPQLAEQVTSRPGVYFARGICGTALRSLGIAGTGFSALLYAPAAAFAYDEALAGRLTYASDRFTIARGDAYVIDTTRGTYVLIRSRKNNGSAEAGTGVLECQRTKIENVDYTVVPPALLAAWTSLIQQYGWVWPAAVATKTAGRDLTFTTNGPGGSVVAYATCAADTNCKVSTGVGTDTYVGVAALELSDLKEQARAAR